MDIFANVKLYKKEPIQGSLLNYLFFQDEKGRDWYETRENWSAAISVNPVGLVCAFEEDVTKMTMIENHTVYEVDPATVPEDVIGNFSYINSVYHDIRPSLSELAQRVKTDLLNTANNEIAPLQNAVDLGMATDEEKTRLTAWKKYTVLLNRVDLSKAPDIVWPNQPAD